MDTKDAWAQILGMTGGQGYLQQFNNAGKGLAWLNDNARNIEGETSGMKQYLKGQQANAGLSALTSLTSGITGLAGTTLNAAKTGDTSYYDARLDNMTPATDGNYYTNSQVLQNNASFVPGFHMEAKDINPTFGESAGKIGSGALQGATLGTQLFGPGWGTLGGLVVGGVVTGLGDAYGRKGNELTANIYNHEANRLEGVQALRTQTAADQAHDFQFGQAWKNRKADGGKIEKKQQTLQEFADAVLKNRTKNESSRSAGIIRQHCNGGIMVRIKVK